MSDIADKVQDAIDAYESEIEDLKDNIKDLEKESDDVSTQLDSAKDEIEELQSELEASENEVKRLQEIINNTTHMYTKDDIEGATFIHAGTKYHCKLNGNSVIMTHGTGKRINICENPVELTLTYFNNGVWKVINKEVIYEIY